MSATRRIDGEGPHGPKAVGQRPVPYYIEDMRGERPGYDKGEREPKPARANENSPRPRALKGMRRARPGASSQQLRKRAHD